MKHIICSSKELSVPASATAVHNPLTESTLLDENHIYHNTGGVSEENKGAGFRPAFRDFETGKVYLSRFADGRCAPMHLIEGLQEEVVLARNIEGKIIKIKKSVSAGFVRLGLFYTRAQAASALAM